MKKSIVLSVCLWIASLAGLAQGVQFEQGSWSQILAKAQAENKPVFVDVYTTWCGPCKHVSEHVFPQEKLGEYYNKRFVNYKIDAESPEGKAFVKNYRVSAYPTFFYIGKDGKMIYRITGSQSVEGFIKEAQMAEMYTRHGGQEAMMTALKNGTASKEMLWDYYVSANNKEKPAAVNLYLKALSDEELFSVENKIIGEISLYDYALLKRLAQGMVKISNDKRYQDNEFKAKFIYCIAFPVEYHLSKYITRSITEGNRKWFDELMELKAIFNDYDRTVYGGKGPLDGDLQLRPGRGIFFATAEYTILCFQAQNRVEGKEFTASLPRYMDRLLTENRSLTDSLSRLVEQCKTQKLNGLTRNAIEWSLERSKITPLNIKNCTEYFWKISPSDKATRKLCSRWLSFAFQVNPFNGSVILPIADLLNRIGEKKEAIEVLEKAITCQEALKTENTKVYRDLVLKLQDVRNGKL